MVQQISTQKTCPKCGAKFDKAQIVCPTDGMILMQSNNAAAGPIEPTALIGQKVGAYEVISIRNTGNKSFIFEVKNELSGRSFAMKMLRPELSQNKSSILRFQQEAKIASLMAHPNSLQVYDFGVSESGQPYLLMELINGVTLDKVIAEKSQLDLKSFKSVVQQLCDVLGSAHKQGVIHRDLKPEHIMLIEHDDADPSVKLLDFGCSKNLEREQKLTVPGLILGNADYMSPEQCSGGNIDGRTDVYSLGCIMYYALTGRKPFEGNIVEVMQRHLAEIPPSPKEVNPEVYLPEALEQAIFKAMSKDPKERQQSVGELWTEIQHSIPEKEFSPQAGSEDKPGKQSFLDGLVKHFKKLH